MTQVPTNFLPNAPVHLVRPNGSVRAFGFGAASDSARGTALASAFNAHAAGDSIHFGPDDFEISSSLLPLDGVSLVGVGNPRIVATGLTTPAIRIINDDVTLTGFRISTNSSGLGEYSVTPISVSNFTVRDLEIAVSDGQGNGIAWSDTELGSTTEHTISATLWNCKVSSPVAAGGAGYGIRATLASSSVIKLFDCDVFGDTDAVLFAGSSSAIVTIYGGEYRSTLDSITSGGATIIAVAARSRGDQADLYSDGGPVIGIACDVSSTDYVVGAGASNSLVLTRLNGTTLTPAGLALLDDASAAAQRATIGINKKTILIPVIDAGEVLSTGDNKRSIPVPSTCDGGVITAVYGYCGGTDGLTLQLARVRSGSPADVLSTAITIDDSETSSRTAATPPAINSSNDDLAAATDWLRVDCDATTNTTGPVFVEVEVTK